MKHDDEQKIDEILSRGVSEFIDPDGMFRAKLLKKARGEYEGDIIIKFGADPTRPDIHLGHAVILHKLRQLQDVGCKVVFIVGDFTAGIGDPTGKSKTRPELAQREIEENMKTYVEQIGKILRIDKEVFAWIRNSDWFVSPLDLSLPEDYKVSVSLRTDKGETGIPLNPNSLQGKMIAFENTRMQKTSLGLSGIQHVSLSNVLWTLRRITYGRLIQRDMFQDRITQGEPLSLHELLYPVFQGIDSSVIAKMFGSCDLEIGGTDQTFNMLMGRDIMAADNLAPQAVISTTLLLGTDGVEKMSKSLDNYVGITDEPADMYGKVMSVPDEVVPLYFELCTYLPHDEIQRITKEVTTGKMHPRDAKMRLAHALVATYHGEAKADGAGETFAALFQKGGFPDDAPQITVAIGTPLGDIARAEGIVASNAEYRRLINQGGITNADTGEKITNPAFTITTPINLKIGKRRFLKIIA